MDASQLDWESDSTHWFVNPRLSGQDLADFKRIQKEAPHLPGHIWIQSSGSSRRAEGVSSKWIALSKQAFLISAAGVNLVIEASSRDIWGLTLPVFHVGGLSLFARAHLSGALVHVIYKDSCIGWDPKDFVDEIRRFKVTHTSIVPTQLHDIVKMNLFGPEYLKCVFVGGAAADPSVVEKARAMGWPIRVTYGMTEVCSQIATSGLDDFNLKLLPHIRASVGALNELVISSSALFTGLACLKSNLFEYHPVKTIDGFWTTSDRASLSGDLLSVLGRSDDFVKINGEGVSITSLRTEFQQHLRDQGFDDCVEWELGAISDQRRGALLFVVSPEAAIFDGVLSWNKFCFPLVRLQYFKMSQIPRNELGKVKLNDLSSSIALQLSQNGT